MGLDVIKPGRFRTCVPRLWALAAALALPMLEAGKALRLSPWNPRSGYLWFLCRLPAALRRNLDTWIRGALRGLSPRSAPVLILIGLAFPATSGLMRMYDTRDAEMTVKVTGYQWMWKYEYLGEGVEFTSRLDRRSEEVRQSGVDARTANHPHYLLDVDNALVLPVGTKVRFVLTADDVIHAWWVPALGWKQDAIPGLVNEAWAQIEKPGVYRGQCAELCGKDHGFMPIVVKAVSKPEFDTWLAAEKARLAPPAAAEADAAAPAPAAGAAPGTEANDAAPAEADAAPQAEQAPADAAAAA